MPYFTQWIGISLVISVGYRIASLHRQCSIDPVYTWRLSQLSARCHKFSMHGMQMFHHNWFHAPDIRYPQLKPCGSIHFGLPHGGVFHITFALAIYDPIYSQFTTAVEPLSPPKLLIDIVTQHSEFLEELSHRFHRSPRFLYHPISSHINKPYQSHINWVHYNDLTVLPHWKSWLVREMIPFYGLNSA